MVKIKKTYKRVMKFHIGRWCPFKTLRALLVVGLGIWLFVAASLAIGDMLFGSSFEPKDFRVETYDVKSGDTLWSIGLESISGTDCDVRDWIYEVKKLNPEAIHDGIVWAGDALEIYVAR